MPPNFLVGGDASPPPPVAEPMMVGIVKGKVSGKCCVPRDDQQTKTLPRRPSFPQKNFHLVISILLHGTEMGCVYRLTIKWNVLLSPRSRERQGLQRDASRSAAPRSGRRRTSGSACIYGIASYQPSRMVNRNGTAGSPGY